MALIATDYQSGYAGIGRIAKEGMGKIGKTVGDIMDIRENSKKKQQLVGEIKEYLKQSYPQESDPLMYTAEEGPAAVDENEAMLADYKPTPEQRGASLAGAATEPGFRVPMAGSPAPETKAKAKPELAEPVSWIDKNADKLDKLSVDELTNVAIGVRKENELWKSAKSAYGKLIDNARSKTGPEVLAYRYKDVKPEETAKGWVAFGEKELNRFVKESVDNVIAKNPGATEEEAEQTVMTNWDGIVGGDVPYPMQKVKDMIKGAFVPYKDKMRADYDKLRNEWYGLKAKADANSANAKARKASMSEKDALVDDYNTFSQLSIKGRQLSNPIITFDGNERTNYLTEANSNAKMAQNIYAQIAKKYPDAVKGLDTSGLNLEQQQGGGAAAPAPAPGQPKQKRKLTVTPAQ